MFSIRTLLTIKFDVWVYTAFLLATTTFFFLDPEAYAPKIVVVGAAWILLGIIVARRTFRFRAVFLLVLGYFLLIQVSKFGNLGAYSSVQDLIYPWGLVNILFLLYFLSEDRLFALKVIDRYISIFAYLSAPSIFFFFALMFNLGLDYQLITLGGREEMLYRNYYNLAIFGDYQILSFENFTIARLAGMFEEAGMLGTYVSILLAADLIAFPEKGLRKVVLLILGALSLSLAFYLFLPFIVTYVAIKKKAAMSMIFLLCVIAGAIAFVPNPLKDAFSNLVVERFRISEEGFLEGDTRYIEYSAQYSDYLAAVTAPELAFGHGARSNRLDHAANYASYQSIVYEGGFLGLLLVLSFAGYLLFWIPLRNRDYLTCVLSFFPFLSLYQRPDFLSSYFIVIYAAIFFTSLKNAKHAKSYRGRRQIVAA